MADISNKTLALFLLTSMIVSLGGFVATFNHLDAATLTGRATTDTGQANFTINSTLSVVFTNNLVDFGTGIVNQTGSGHVCTLNTSATNPITGPDCIGFNASVNPLRIQNQGTVNVTLNISFNATAAQYVGGTTPGFSFQASLNETGACGNITAESAFLNRAITQITAANTNYSICNSSMFNWQSNNRTINLDLGISIPQDALSGGRRVVVTAYAS